VELEGRGIGRDSHDPGLGTIRPQLPVSRARSCTKRKLDPVRGREEDNNDIERQPWKMKLQNDGPV